jgi:hypothetical protein
MIITVLSIIAGVKLWTWATFFTGIEREQAFARIGSALKRRGLL